MIQTGGMMSTSVVQYEIRNYPSAWCSEDRRLLYNTGGPQYNPEVSHGYVGSLLPVRIGLVENLL